ncbi:MAG: FtsB family cell division protein [Elusimicrobiota bacterium]
MDLSIFKTHKKWIIIGGFALLMMIYVFNGNVRKTISNQKAIRQANQELTELNQEVVMTREKLNSLNKNPTYYEYLVRRDLGYLRPGEKEIRFINQ